MRRFYGQLLSRWDKSFIDIDSSIWLMFYDKDKFPTYKSWVRSPWAGMSRRTRRGVIKGTSNYAKVIRARSLKELRDG